jgi:hypothetical protein
LKPVFQTIFDADGGNCLSAVIASILELPLEEVPNFAKDNGDDCDKAATAWLKDRGLGCISIGFDSLEWMAGAYFDNLGEYCILLGPSNFKDRGHAVVGKVGDKGKIDVAHDPIPGGTGALPGFRWVHFIVKRSDG